MIIRRLALAAALLLSTWSVCNFADAQDPSSGNLCTVGDNTSTSNGLQFDALIGQSIITAISRKDYAAERALLLPLAEQGNAQAQYNLATMYDNGEGSSADPTEAVRWYKRSAEQGYPAAEYNMASHLANGQGVIRDLPSAASWMNKAANSGVPMAEFGLARFYLTGQAAAKSYDKALYWSSKAADQGLAEAQFTVAILYAEGGAGVAKDPVKAWMWADLATKRFTSAELSRRQIAERDRDLIAQELSNSDRARANDLEQAWLGSHHPCRAE